MRSEEIVIWLGVGGLLVGALAGEYKSTKDVTNRVKAALNAVQSQTVSTCDIVANGAQLNDWSSEQLNIQWRRGIIASCILCLVLNPVAGLQLSSRQALTFLVLSWVVITGMAGYSDYHMRKVAQNGVGDCLFTAVNKIASDGGVCSPTLFNTVTIARKK